VDFLRVLLFSLLCAGLAKAGLGFSTVVVDAGHGGADKGALREGVRESRLTLQVAKRLEALLKKKGVSTVMTRREDVYVSKEQRVAITNRQRKPVLVSIHFNACTDTSCSGTETFYGGPGSRVLGEGIQRRLAAEAKTRNRGARQRDLAVLSHSKCPAVLVECGFISQAAERSRCGSGGYQQAVAQAICDGIMAAR
jgi:N-acetylmuramoyl-L-alanine amidase